MAKKILVIDDDHGSLLLVESLLKANGYEVLTLDFPKDTMKLIKRERPDLVLLDILMPYKDGYKVCEEIKTVYGKKIPVIVFTAKPYEKDLIPEAHKDFGADDYVLKPFDSKTLLEKIKKLAG